MKRILFATLLVALPVAAGPLSSLFSNSVTITATTVDAASNLYVAGYVFHTYFPPNTPLIGIPTTPGAYISAVPPCQLDGTCSLAFVVKISGSGALLWGSYLDNVNLNEQPSAIAADSTGNVFVADSSGLLYKLSADGSKLLGSNQIPAGIPAAIAVAPSGEPFVSGQTVDPTVCTFSAVKTSCEFVTITAGAFQTATLGGTDGFVIHFDAALSKPIYATLLSSVGDDRATGIAVNAAGEAYVTGTAGDYATFVYTAGALNQIASAQAKAGGFVVKLRADGSTPVFAARYNALAPGSAFSSGVAIALDGSGVYIAGVNGEAQLQGVQYFSTQFAAKLTPDGSSLVYESTLPKYELRESAYVPGGDGPGIIVTPIYPSLFEIAPDSAGNLVIMSQTDVQISVTSNAFAWCSPTLLLSRFVMELDPTGAVSYESYLPGGLAIRGDGEAWYSDSSGAVNKFNVNAPLPPGVRCVADAFTGLTGPIAPGKLVTLMGPGIGPDVPAMEQIDGSGKVAVGLNGVNLYFNGIAAPLLSVSSNQIEAVVPFENLNPVEFPTSTVAILKNGMEIDGPPVPVAATASALLMDSQGCISGFNSDGTLNTQANPATLGSFVAIFGEGAGLMSPAVTGGIGNGQSRILAASAANLSGPSLEAVGVGPLTPPLTILYAGDVPGFVEGLFEMNLQLPTSYAMGTFSTGQEQINVTIGNSTVFACVWLKPAN